MSCGHEHHEHGHGGHSHDDDDHVRLEGGQDFLYARIDRDNVVALNAVESDMGKNVIKPWEDRDDETRYLESDADDQLLVRVPFTGNVKLRSVIIKAGPATLTPSEIKLFQNSESIDFNDVAEATPTQTLQSVPVSREAVEYPVKAAKFPAVRDLTLFIPASQGAETTRIYFLGFRGEFSEFRREAPAHIVYEAAPSIADHMKVQGTDPFSAGLDDQH